MEDLLGLIIFLLFVVGRFMSLNEHTERKTRPQRKTLPEWIEDWERRVFPPEPVETRPKPIEVEVDRKPPEPAPEKPPAPPKETAPGLAELHPPEPERISVSRATLREPSETARALFRPCSLKQAIIMKEVLGPPKARQNRRGPRL
ncbi:MAG: hypothetical protein H0Z38_01075 [Firmicutes bacterium]|nr:hypothetical protein [Bacillota bacterium]